MCDRYSIQLNLDVIGLSLRDPVKFGGPWLAFTSMRHQSSFVISPLVFNLSLFVFRCCVAYLKPKCLIHSTLSCKSHKNGCNSQKFSCEFALTRVPGNIIQPSELIVCPSLNICNSYSWIGLQVKILSYPPPHTHTHRDSKDKTAYW